ncbi:uncharacterized protein LOC116210780 [Punica granatum]|uniref:Uncharacterized protein LOC116210780 n=2 Tax=Punica granatum TaxID=22663 RepID=A0A6P8E2H7_PUNGR|nr:uncharacterized protein LOC116210780 [Punica granatum]XP_031400689.1 uncharacterized protein LOC116210780 [Punica granatum]XP_031400690.1 uncharacterized protein LOC116210780 [Punica granatum]PKI53162.1 hypothetical protein CRG98_026467 [Punica granatum]
MALENVPKLRCNANGLTTESTNERLGIFGDNKLEEKESRHRGSESGWTKYIVNTEGDDGTKDDKINYQDDDDDKDDDTDNYVTSDASSGVCHLVISCGYNS